MTPTHPHAKPHRIASLLLCVLAATTVACRSAEKDNPSSESARAPAEPPVELHGVGTIEGRQAAYDESRQPAKLIAALGLSPGHHVADVGAGLGYFTPRLSDVVGPTGQVVATDINDEVLARLRKHMADRKNVVVRKVAPDEPGLEPGTYDLILLSEVDHFFADRVDYLRKLRPALRPTGRIAVTHVRAMRQPLVDAAQAAGYAIVYEYNGLPQHYLLFLQPAASALGP